MYIRIDSLLVLGSKHCGAIGVSALHSTYVLIERTRYSSAHAACVALVRFHAHSREITCFRVITLHQRASREITRTFPPGIIIIYICQGVMNSLTTDIFRCSSTGLSCYQDIDIVVTGYWFQTWNHSCMLYHTCIC